MNDAILVLNAGSSSLKFAVHPREPGEPLLRESIAMSDSAFAAAVERVAGHRIVAVGHRVVHGGLRSEPASIAESVLAELEDRVPWAPLHLPLNIAGIRAARTRFPDAPHVACFDTAFHRRQPRIAQLFGLPRHYADDGILRYGFHGLSYESIASRLPAGAGRTIVAHLGNGASLCAMKNGASIATTMSFTPTDGLLMGTRCGSLDPGVILYLMNHRGMTTERVERLIDCESGLLGVSGISSDMRELLASGDPRAAEAVDLFIYRIGREIGSLAAALGGLDMLVFTGGIGENAPVIRDRIAHDARWLGAFAVRTIPTDEEGTIAEHTRRTLGLGRG